MIISFHFFKTNNLIFFIKKENINFMIDHIIDFPLPLNYANRLQPKLKIEDHYCLICKSQNKLIQQKIGFLKISLHPNFIHFLGCFNLSLSFFNQIFLSSHFSLSLPLSD
ncbi:hypothetical protein ABPG72_009513 [Tetrahymena utriculariae]